MCQISRLLLWKSPQECQNVTIEFCFIMRIFYELRYTVIIEIVWTFYLKSVPAKFQKYFKLISWVISGTRSSKLSCNPRHPSRNISCSHRHHLLQPSWRRIFSTSNNQKTMVDSDINIDYKASSFDKLYIWRRKWDTAGFVRAHQRKYWNALTVGRGHADDGCSCNHLAVPPVFMDSIFLNACYHRSTADRKLLIVQVNNTVSPKRVMGPNTENDWLIDWPCILFHFHNHPKITIVPALHLLQ